MPITKLVPIFERDAVQTWFELENSIIPRLVRSPEGTLVTGKISVHPQLMNILSHGKEVLHSPHPTVLDGTLVVTIQARAWRFFQDASLQRDVLEFETKT